MRLIPRCAPIGHIRGWGSILAFDLLTARGSEDADPAATTAVVQRAYELGLILLKCGANSETIRLLYPPTIPEDQPDEAWRC
ncbi:MAG: aminotransferase class III-fold pyridoxal phosphate-dependent enzyme [Rhodanobacter sp.]|nr:MAG: aminotransferase class III-fold pyridoxal phosphate-dependent enzyme [Rhodanobacter sp.]TAL97033.1 MAG: aminotransferase class III-fold pyridoxal phosphate-dependent enzyme [Rhodanobacter sp.]TAM42427.1 MAG: aminotransferase class III-fold pyridoxal phosphate-dependent enzyme [Rhodanobacter sp.]